MKTKLHNILTSGALLSGVAGVVTSVHADYGPAIWNPPSGCTKYYSSGYGHKFHVIHDMEGYYLSSVSLLRSCSSSVSVFYAVNGKQDTSTDAAAGQITQMVHDADYAWHVCCWNKYCTGTEHEGFASNPAWYTSALYHASAGLTKYLQSEFGWTMDRNHVVGHNEWLNSHWTGYAGSAFGINTGCNTHHDPGSFWDWSTFMSLCSGAKKTTVWEDFNSDGLADYCFFRATNATWNVRFSTDGSTRSFSFGQSTDIPLLSGDFDGDGNSDAVLFRPSTSMWYVRFSTDASVHSFSFGTGGDKPLLGGDFDGDGSPDAVLFRPSNSTWYVRFSSDASVHSFAFGTTGDIPLIGGDFDGDGAPDAVLFRPSTSTWYVRFSKDASVHSFSFGSGSDTPLLGGDFDGDGVPDAVLFDPSTSMWNVRFSSTGAVHSFSFGTGGDIPLLGGDYSGDGAPDAVLFRPSTGTWYVRFSDDGSVHSFAFGTNGDTPIIRGN